MKRSSRVKESDLLIRGGGKKEGNLLYCLFFFGYKGGAEAQKLHNKKSKSERTTSSGLQSTWPEQGFPLFIFQENLF